MSIIDTFGIDVEQILDKSVALDIGTQIHNGSELRELTTHGFLDEVATTLIFSAKESFFKAVFTEVGEYFGFECARVVKNVPECKLRKLRTSPAI